MLALAAQHAVCTLVVVNAAALTTLALTAFYSSRARLPLACARYYGQAEEK